MKTVPIIATVIVAALFLLAAQFLLPTPDPLPVVRSQPAAPPTLTPTPTPTAQPVVDYRKSLPNSDKFQKLADFTGSFDGGARPLGLMVDVEGSRVLFEGEIATTLGRIEYMLSAPGGKVYEALVMGFVDPMAFNVALTAIGCKQPEGMDSRNFFVSPEGEVDAAWSRLKVELVYQDATGKIVARRAEEFILDQFRDAPMPSQLWAYTGSYFFYAEDIDQEFWAAGTSKDLVAVFRDSSCVVMSADREWQNDDLYVANSSAMPPKGTRVLVLFSRVAEDQAK